MFISANNNHIASFLSSGIHQDCQLDLVDIYQVASTLYHQISTTHPSCQFRYLFLNIWILFYFFQLLFQAFPKDNRSVGLNGCINKFLVSVTTVTFWSKFNLYLVILCCTSHKLDNNCYLSLISNMILWLFCISQYILPNGWCVFSIFYFLYNIYV